LAAKTVVPIYARFMSAFGSVASGVRMEKKNATGNRIAADGIDKRTNHLERYEREASST
jgi:hypothetical protein